MPISAANAPAESEAAGRLARRRSSPLSRPPTRESRFALLRRHQLLCSLDRGFAKRSLDPDCSVVSDTFSVSPASPMLGARTRSSRPGLGQKSGLSLQMGQHRAGNIKAAITGTYRAISSKHVPRYLAEFNARLS